MPEQEKKYIEIIDTIVIALDEKGEITFLNKKSYEILGYKEGELIGKNWFETFLPSNIKNEVYDVYKKLMKGEIELVRYYENPIITKSGQEKIIFWKNTFLTNKRGKIIGILSSGEDITERKKNEKNIRKLNRSFKMLSESNLLLSITESEIELFQKLCTTIVNIGGYRLAWIGLVKHDKEKSVFPIAHAGFEEGYIDTLKVSWADTERGRGQTGTCIRTKKYFISKDIKKNPKYDPWRKTAIVHDDLDSSISLPIIIGNDVIASLSIYSVDKDTFDQEEVDLLLDMVNNLSLAIEKKRYFKKIQDERNKKEKSIKKINRAFKMLSESNLLLTTVDSEIELFQKLCTTIVETGGYRAAWIGVVQHDKEKSVLPVANAGFEKGYLDSFKVSWADTKRGQGSTGNCIRTKTYHIVTGLSKDPKFIHWREIAEIYNVDSSIALPIIIENVVIASLCIYWVEDYTLDQEEIDLLSDMVTNLSLAIEKRRNHKKTQDKIKKEQEYFITIFSAFADGVYIVNENYDIQYVNPILIEDFGSWEGKKCYAYFHNR